MVNLIAKRAQPRLMELLKLKSTQHIYDPVPGKQPGKFIVVTGTDGGREVVIDKLKQTTQPYVGIERFVSDERIMSYIIDPGLVPIVKALLTDARGRRFLYTRKLNSTPEIAADLDGFGLRITLTVNERSDETELTWECLYGVF